jgi:hypothetical protein
MHERQPAKPEQARRPAARPEPQPRAALASEHDRWMELQRRIGNQAVGHILQRRSAPKGSSADKPAKTGSTRAATQPGLQTKLGDNQAGDACEQEADRIAEQVIAKPLCPNVSSGPPRIHRFTAQSAEAANAAPASVDQVLASPGRPLEPVLRQDMEQRFGFDFSSVEVHAGSAPAASARELGAHAYTTGHHVVFGAGLYAPETHEGRRLIAHELVHVVQQAERVPADLCPVSLPMVPLVQRQPAPQPTVPAAAAHSRKWKDVLRDLRFARISDPTRVSALVQELLEVAETPGYDLDLLNEAMDMVVQLSAGGDIPAADRLLEVIQRKFLTAFMTGRDLPSGGMLWAGAAVQGDPAALITLAEGAARDGNHERAFKLFGAAHEILSYLALAATEKTKATTDVSKRSSRYRQFEGIYREMREIYSFYFVLEAEALAAGDAGRAAEARDRASKLREELKANHTPYAESAAEIAEESQVSTPTGRPAFRFHGANYEETDLTELPGHPFSSSLLATGEAQEPQDLGLLQTALMAQAEFQAEIAREPEIRKAFGQGPVDLNDTAKRLKVWGILYGVYKGRGTGALASLMALIGRYLKAYTYHTGFNVRDFGASYLASEMPSDLAGRLVRDCGVYALTVAWDVFQTVKAGDSKLKVSFTLATLLDHVILVITDNATGDSYLVNNDQITKVARPVGYAPQFTRPEGMSPNVDLFLEDPTMPPPKAPDLDEEVARQYAQLRDLPYLVTPVNYLELGSTSDPASSFKAAAWQRYLAATEYMAKVPVNFSMLQDFSKDCAALDELVNELAPSAGDADTIAKWLQDGWSHITSLLVRFEQIGPKAFRNITPATTRPAGSRDSGAFRWPGSNHPLIRVALVLLRLRSLGRPLTNDQQKYLTFFETAFEELMDKSRHDAESGRF